MAIEQGIHGVEKHTQNPKPEPLTHYPSRSPSQIHPVVPEPITLEEEYDESVDYPEGGTEAWLVVLGAWCAMIPSMGLLNTVGVLQAWVSEHELRSYSESNIGWIFSAYAFFLYILGAQVGK